MSKIDLRQGDCLELMKDIPDGSVDAIITDPPYGYSFMGKDWDKAVPSVEIWQECLRVLKPGAFACVMSAPRSDVQNAMISRLMDAGFRLDFTPIYWSYSSGFPKAGNIGKLVDKRLGATREIIGSKLGQPGYSLNPNKGNGVSMSGNVDGSLRNPEAECAITAPATPQAKALDGSYAGFQPKPAVEVIIVAMKPLSEKTYVDQALKNGKGISWLDDCRVPTDVKPQSVKAHYSERVTTITNSQTPAYNPDDRGRFPANLLVSDQALNGHSKYFDLDAWADTLPFLAVPKASKSEKNKGLVDITCSHPTVKPLKLMSYLITLFSREGDTVLDPFMGSGSTGVAAKNLNRNFIGIELDEEYFEIAKKRIEEADK